MRSVIFAMLAAIAASGCSGTLTTKVLQSKVVAPGWSGRGIIAYPTAYFKEEYTTTTIVQNGKVVAHSLDGSCTPQTTYKLAALADYSRPMLISYNPGLLESYKLGVELNADGSLKSVNVSSTPDQGNTLKNLGAAATSVAGLAAKAVRRGRAPPCTDGAGLTGLERYQFPSYPAR